VENILQLVERSPGTISQRISCILVFHRQEHGEHYTMQACNLHHVQCVQQLEPGDPAKRLEFFHWLNVIRQLHWLILFTNEATFTHDSINNNCNSHRWSHENPNAIAETDFQHRFSTKVWCGIINDQAQLS
jgi:hypothetical protein